MILRHHKKTKFKKGFSLLELLISISIMAVIMILFLNILTLTAEVTFKAIARSNLREEMSNIANLVTRDIRNSNIILECGQESPSDSCTMSIGDEVIRWSICEVDRYCREVYNSSTSDFELDFRSQENLLLNEIAFERGFIDTNSSSENNVLFTMTASHRNEDTGVENLLLQKTISTRNYEL